MTYTKYKLLTRSPEITGDQGDKVGGTIREKERHHDLNQYTNLEVLTPNAPYVWNIFDKETWYTDLPVTTCSTKNVGTTMLGYKVAHGMQATSARTAEDQA